MTRRPNILLFVTDDHGQWACGAYGNGEIRTPHLDELARSGVVMENAFTPTPVCSPARASLLTGLLPSQHGIHDYIAMAFDRGPWLHGQITLAQILQAAGYRTGLVGKWHAGNEDSPAPGFDAWFSVGSAYPLEHRGTRAFCRQGGMETRSGNTDEIVAAEALSFLASPDERPFFLLVGLTATHSPWADQPERLVAPYRTSPFSAIPRGEVYPFGQKALESLSVDRDREPEARAQYYAAVSHVDEQMGRLLAALGERGQQDQTLVIYTSDHGLNCGHHGIWGKGNGTRPVNMLEESIRVPLILNWPGRLPAGMRRPELVDHLDLFQSILDWTETGLPRDIHSPGCSFAPLLRDSPAHHGQNRILFGEYGPTRMARTARHKLILHYPDGPHRLFDLQTDPREGRDCYGDLDYRPVVEQLTEAAEAHFRQYSTPQHDGRLGSALPRYNRTESWRP